MRAGEPDLKKKKRKKRSTLPSPESLSKRKGNNRNSSLPVRLRQAPAL